MGLFNLSRLCFAVFLAPSLVFASGQEVRVGVSPTTSYSVKHDSVRVPSNAKVSPVKDISPIVNASARGGFEQTMRAGITIEANKTIPFSVKARASAATMARGAKAFLKSGKLNPYMLAGSIGLQTLLDGVDWVMTDGSVSKETPIYPDVSDPSWTGIAYKYGNSGWHPTPTMACAAIIGIGAWADGNKCRGPGGGQGAGQIMTKISLNNSPSRLCPSGDWNGSSCILGSSSSPVSGLDIDSLVDSSYVPQVSDFSTLAPYMLPDDLFIEPIPTFYNDPVTKTIYDGAGNPVRIEETNSYVEFTIDNSVTSNPSISTKTNTETKTYEDGVLVGSSTTSKDSKSTEPATSTGGGGGISVSPNIEIPTDCDFHPTICAWLDWTKKDDDIGEEVDLRQLLHEEDYEKTNTVSFGSKSCPEPLLINLSVVDSSYELSFQPICTLAEYMYYFIMAASYIFAAYIALGVSRNG